MDTRLESGRYPSPLRDYYELLRDQPDYRRLWIGQFLSNFGTWLTLVAQFVLVEKLANSAVALGLVLSTRLLALGLPQAITGLFADAFNRKKLMVWSNVLSMFSALLLLTINEQNELWRLYAIIIAIMFFHAIYMPAERASLTNIVPESDISTAGALDADTWSLSLALGAAAGGFITAAYGTNTAFVIDAITFALSAVLILSIKIPQETDPNLKKRIWRSGLSDIRSGWSRSFTTPLSLIHI